MYDFGRKGISLFVIALLLVLTGAAVSQTQREENIWKKVQGKIDKAPDIPGKIEIYRNFISQYPKNHYVEKAKNAIAELEQEQEFSRIRSENSVESYRGFLKKYPKSKFMEDIKKALFDLNMDEVDVDYLVAGAWDAAAAFEEFLSKHPEGKWVEDANRRISELKNCSLSVTSNPSGAAVYAALEDPHVDAADLIKDSKYSKGKTPLEFKLEPGTYLVVVFTRYIPEEIQKLYKPATSGISLLTGCQIMTVDPNNVMIQCKEDGILDLCGRVYSIKIGPNEEKTLEVKNLHSFD